MIYKLKLPDNVVHDIYTPDYPYYILDLSDILSIEKLRDYLRIQSNVKQAYIIIGYEDPFQLEMVYQNLKYEWEKFKKQAV